MCARARARGPRYNVYIGSDFASRGAYADAVNYPAGLSREAIISASYTFRERRDRRPRSRRNAEKVAPALGARSPRKESIVAVRMEFSCVCVCVCASMGVCVRARACVYGISELRSFQLPSSFVCRSLLSLRSLSLSLSRRSCLAALVYECQPRITNTHSSRLVRNNL